MYTPDNKEVSIIPNYRECLIYSTMKSKTFLFSLFFSITICINLSAQPTIWQIGKPDGSPNEFALAPDNFKDFVHKDFGFEDKFYLVSYSDTKKTSPLHCQVLWTPGVEQPDFRMAYQPG